MSSNQLPYTFKIKSVIIGNSAVGKSCILQRYVDNTFTNMFISTVGIDFKQRIIDVTSDDGTKSDRICMQIWDTAGQERFKTITTAYYRGAMGIIYVYDVTDMVSFKRIEHWIADVRAHECIPLGCMILGNKIDKNGERQVTTEQGRALAEKNGCLFYEVSAKTGENVEPAFQQLAKIVYNKLLLTDGRKNGEKQYIILPGVDKTHQSKDACAC